MARKLEPVLVGSRTKKSRFLLKSTEGPKFELTQPWYAHDNGPLNAGLRLFETLRHVKIKKPQKLESRNIYLLYWLKQTFINKHETDVNESISSTGEQTCLCKSAQ